MKYKVLNHEFDTWDDVEKWAWNTHKIDTREYGNNAPDENDRQQLCDQLAEMIAQEKKTWAEMSNDEKTTAVVSEINRMKSYAMDVIEDSGLWEDILISFANVDDVLQALVEGYLDNKQMEDTDE